MKIKAIIVGIIVGTIIGTILEILCIFILRHTIILPISVLIGAILAAAISRASSKRAHLVSNNKLQHLPFCAADFLRLVVKKMRYRKKVRADVQAELASHFEDELRDCKTDEEKEQKAQRLIEYFGDVKLLAVLLRRAKKRCRPLWRTVVVRTFQTVGVLLLCLIAYTVWFLTGKPAVTVDYLTEANRLARPAADESLNATPFFEKAVAICPNMPEESAGFWRKSYFDANEAERRVIEGWVQLHVDSLNLITQGTEKPHFWRQYKTKGGPNDDGSMIGVLLPDLATFRRLAYAFCFRTDIQAQNGLYTEALESLITCYKFGRLIRQGQKAVIEQLVGIAIEAKAIGTTRELLNNCQLETRYLEQLQKKFELAASGEDFTANLLPEKLFVYDEIQRSFTEDRLGGGHPYLKRLTQLTGKGSGFKSPPEKPLSLVFHILFTHPNKQQTRETADDFYDFWRQMATKSPYQLHKENINLDERTQQLFKGNILLGMMTPPINRIHTITYRIKTDVESTLTIIAILRYQKDRNALPQSLNELVQSGYLQKLPLDPFSDKPLVYLVADNAFTLYSVGLNLIDDGGQVYRDKEGRPQLWHDEFGDAVFWPVQK